MEAETRLYSRDELFRMLAAALIKKKPQPPGCWSVAGLDEEVAGNGNEYEQDLFLRHLDALGTSVFYLVDFARRMPEWVDLSLQEARVREMCGELSDEIEQITYEPEKVIARCGKLKSWLKAILAVQTCLIYREETARVIAEEQKAKSVSRPKAAVKGSPGENKSRSGQREPDLVKNILQKVLGVRVSSDSEQPTLF